MATLRLFGGDLGGDEIRVRCDLTQASAPVLIDLCHNGKEDQWESTQYQCADARHDRGRLAAIARRLSAVACEIPDDEFECEVEELD